MARLFSPENQFEGSDNAVSNADLTFNEVAIGIAGKLKHQDENGGVPRLLTRQDVLSVTQAVSPIEKQHIAAKPAAWLPRTSYNGLRPNPRSISPPQGLRLPPIDL